MQDKLIKLLEIKIEAINKNIDNLNYLNEELDKNSQNLDYLGLNISKFENEDVLNFDQIEVEDFDKILSMVDSSVSEIFQDKTCNYQGIMYIINGIRQGISLELTIDQKNAILAFVNGMKEKELVLEDTIANLNESKERLPEDNLDILESDLKNYQDILEKFKNNSYLTEIDDITEALDFSDSTTEEKMDIFEFILKYNADIYEKTKVFDKVEDEEVVPLNEIKVPEFHFEPVNLEEPTDDDSSDVNVSIPIINSEETGPNFLNPENIELPKVEVNEELEDNLDKEENLDDTLKINNLIKSLDEQLKALDEKEKKEENSQEVNEKIEDEKLDEVDNGVVNNQTTENNFINTVDLEDIIKKIDAKLKEMEENPEKEEEMVEIEEPVLPEVVLPVQDNVEPESNPQEELEETGIIQDNQNDTALKEVLNKYELSDSLLNYLSNKNVDVLEIDEILNILKDNQILELLKDNILSNILLNNKKENLNELFRVIKEKISLNEENYKIDLEIIAKTMPLLLASFEVIDSFMKNIEFYQNNQINLINLFDNYRELLIMDNDSLLTNYANIKNYGLELNNDNVKYLLYNANILENLDYYIEAIGHEKGFLGKEDEFDGIKYITENPYKLNMINKNTLMKLRFSTENNLKIYGSKPGILAGEIANPKVDLLVLPSDYKNLYFNNEYAFIDRSEMMNLDLEIKENKVFDTSVDELIEKLDSLYKISDLRYKINENLFSRIKTIRLYNFLKGKGLNLKNALIIALTYNTVIKKDEYETVMNIINALEIGGN